MVIGLDQLQLSIVSQSKNVCNGKLIIAPINTTITDSLKADFSVLFIIFLLYPNARSVCENFRSSLSNV